MKKLVALALLLLCGSALAQPIVVFAKDNFVTLNPGAAVSRTQDPAQSAFLDAFQRDLAQPAAFAAPIPLIGPPEWGRTVPGAAGTLQFHESFPGGFVVQVALTGLAPHHPYKLCLNGRPDLAGNDRLVDVVPGLDKERYFDFLTATTDDQGNYRALFAIALPAGPYHVRFYVKDTDDFKIVLYHDYFKFKVDGPGR